MIPSIGTLFAVATACNIKEIVFVSDGKVVYSYINPEFKA